MHVSFVCRVYILETTPLNENDYALEPYKNPTGTGTSHNANFSHFHYFRGVVKSCDGNYLIKMTGT